MNYVLKYPGKIIDLVETGYQLVKDTYSVENMVNNTEALYLSLTA